MPKRHPLGVLQHEPEAAVLCRAVRPDKTVLRNQPQGGEHVLELVRGSDGEKPGSDEPVLDGQRILAGQKPRIGLPAAPPLRGKPIHVPARGERRKVAFFDEHVADDEQERGEHPVRCPHGEERGGFSAHRYAPRRGKPEQEEVGDFSGLPPEQHEKGKRRNREEGKGDGAQPARQAVIPDEQTVEHRKDEGESRNDARPERLPLPPIHYEEQVPRCRKHDGGGNDVRDGPAGYQEPGGKDGEDNGNPGGLLARAPMTQAEKNDGELGEGERHEDEADHTADILHWLKV